MTSGPYTQAGRATAALQDPDAGSITLDGLDVLADKTGAQRRLGDLPQEFGPYPKFSAEDMLNHVAVLNGGTARVERKALVEALLQQVNLWQARKQAGRVLRWHAPVLRHRPGAGSAPLHPAARRPELCCCNC